MKLLKKLAVVLGVLVAVPLVAAVFIKKDFQVEESIVIAQPKNVVFDYLKFLKNQDQFSKWASMDSEMKKSYQGEDGTEGFVSAWESQNPDVGVGEQEIVRIVDGQRIDYELRFKKPMESSSPAWMITEDAEAGGTVVKWGFSGHMAYPMNLFLLMGMEEAIGNDFRVGLQKLKEILESPRS